jgi:hypothetical protein
MGDSEGVRGCPRALTGGGREDGTLIAKLMGIFTRVFVIDTTPPGGPMMIVSRDVHSRYPSPHAPRIPQKPRIYTPTLEGFERFKRAWVNLPMDDVTTHGAGDATAPDTSRRDNHERGQ